MSNAVRNEEGFPESLKRVQKITGKSLTFYELDIRERGKLEEVFEKHKIDSVLHFAGLKSVNESVSQPLEYYNNNISGKLCSACSKTLMKHRNFNSTGSYGQIRRQKVCLLFISHSVWSATETTGR